MYRLKKARYAETAYSGYGASQSGGRWHPAGTPVVYASHAPASALLEVLVHTEAGALLDHPYVLFTIQCDPERHLLVVPEDAWPDDRWALQWPSSTQHIGHRWFIDRDSVLLEVPSAVVPYQRNYLFNPEHPDFSERDIEGPMPFAIDARLGAYQDEALRI